MISFPRFFHRRFTLSALLFALAILVPNFLMLTLPPADLPANMNDAGWAFTLLERAGQVFCLLLLTFANPRIRDRRDSRIWKSVALVSVALYWMLWARYVISGATFRTLFDPVVIPIPVAVLPTLAFASIAIYRKDIPLGVFTVVFAIGHFANSWHTWLTIR